MNFEKLKANLDAAILECIEVPNEVLPERFHDNREGKSSLARINKILDNEKASRAAKDPNEVSVKFNEDREIVSGTPERLSRIEKYRNDISSGKEIDYNINEHKLYRNQQAFAKVMGLDLEDDDDCSETTYSFHRQHKAGMFGMGRNFTE